MQNLRQQNKYKKVFFWTFTILVVAMFVGVLSLVQFFSIDIIYERILKIASVLIYLMLMIKYYRIVLSFFYRKVDEYYDRID